MNTKQLVSFLTLIIGFATGKLCEKGIIDGSTSPQLAAATAALIIGLIAHIFHSSPPSPPAGSPKTSFLSLIVFGIVMCLFTGCSSAPTTAYKAEAATDVTVSTAMTAWGDYVAAYHPPEAEEAAVKTAFEKYQAAELLAIDATAFYASETATNSTANTSPLDSANADAEQALTDLVNLIKSFGVKL